MHLDEALRCVIRIVEEINLKTNSNVKHFRRSIPHEELAGLRRKYRRALASSITGVVINSALASACQLFAIGAAINLWQAVVCFKNHRRVKQEIKRRLAKDPFLAKHYMNDTTLWPRLKDIAFGVGWKLLLTLIFAGLDGLGDIVNAFAELAAGVTHASDLAIGSLGQDGASLPFSHLAHVMHDNPELASEAFNRVAEAHPQLGVIDNTVHAVNSGPSDAFTHGLEHLLMPGADSIGMGASHLQLSALHADGASIARIAAWAIPIGVFTELVQPLAFAAEKAGEKWRQRRTVTEN